MRENVLPKHIAIIMDGNRRWAKKNNIPIALAHKKGAEVFENTVRYCNKIGLEYFTVYAFSTENWSRTSEEVKAIMTLLEAYLDRFLKKVDLENIRLRILGDLESQSVPETLRNKMREMEKRTQNNTGLNLNIAFNYGGRAEIIRATKILAQNILDGKMKIEDINEETFSNNLYTAGQKDPDLVIRTSGELRTSNFLPWQITYSEFIFLEKFWPEFINKDIDDAIELFQNRNRRRGK